MDPSGSNTVFFNDILIIIFNTHSLITHYCNITYILVLVNRDLVICRKMRDCQVISGIHWVEIIWEDLCLQVFPDRYKLIIPVC